MKAFCDFVGFWTTLQTIIFLFKIKFQNKKIHIMGLNLFANHCFPISKFKFRTKKLPKTGINCPPKESILIILLASEPLNKSLLSCYKLKLKNKKYCISGIYCPPKERISYNLVSLWTLTAALKCLKQLLCCQLSVQHSMMWSMGFNCPPKESIFDDLVGFWTS